MAEKENYIVISKKDFDYKKGHYVTHLAKQMPRKEAIKKISSHLLMCDISTMNTDEIAESALDALLEERHEN